MAHQINVAEAMTEYAEALDCSATDLTREEIRAAILLKSMTLNENLGAEDAKMPHKHKWTLDRMVHEGVPPLGIPVSRFFAYCGCGEEIQLEEIERRLNAVEELSTDDAKFIMDTIDDGSLMYELLKTYAEALSGTG